MSISTTPVQQATGTWSSGSSFTVTLGAAPTNGNFLVCCFDSAQNSVTVTSISQTNVTWTANDADSHTNRSASVSSGQAAASAGTVVTINIAGSPSSASANVSEWSGVATSSALDAHGINNGNSTTPTSATITPTSSRNILLIVGVRLGGAYTSGPDSSFTGLTSPDSSRNYPGYQVVTSSSGSYSCAYVAGSGLWDVAIADYLAPATATSWGAQLSDQLNRIVQGN